MTIRCRMDGLQVLKGAVSKATIYFDTKEATKAALDLNGEEITIGLPDEAAPADPETLESLEYRMTSALAEVSLCSRKLVDLAKGGELIGGMPLFPDVIAKYECKVCGAFVPVGAECQHNQQGV